MVNSVRFTIKRGAREKVLIGILEMKKDNFDIIEEEKKEEDIFKKLGITFWNPHDDGSEFQNK